MGRRRPIHRQVRRPLTVAKKIERAIRGIPIAVFICTLLWAGYAVTKKLIKPIALYRRDMQELSQVEREIRQLRQENVRLRKQTGYLRGSEGAQTEARKLGYVRPGEISIVIQPNPPAR